MKRVKVFLTLKSRKGKPPIKGYDILIECNKDQLNPILCMQDRDIFNIKIEVINEGFNKKPE